MPDYDALLDDEILAFLARSDRIAPKTPGLSVAERRANFDRLWRNFRELSPESVTSVSETWAGVPCRSYTSGPDAFTVVFFHGGGWVIGGLDSHDDLCSELCARTGARVVAVDYPLAPETVFPGCFEASFAAFSEIADAADGAVLVAGDSAGGNLAAAIAHADRKENAGRIAGQLLIYPVLGLATARETPVENAEAPGLTQADMRFFWEARCGGPAFGGDARLAPLEDSDFSGLPPTVILTAEFDPLAEEGREYAAALTNAGVKVALVEEAGLVHGHLRARRMSSRAKASFERMVASLIALGHGDWPVPGL
ncbi:alpha/beta hydrolase [Sulfitobacter sp. LCG007]